MSANAALSPESGADIKLTEDIAAWTSSFTDGDLSDAAREWGKHALLDWISVTTFGAREPLSKMLGEEYGEVDGGPCVVIAQGVRARTHDAALINGSAGHALDYDDVNQQLHGHPSVPVAPAALAVGQALGKSGADVLRAFIIGYQVECEIGGMAGDEHYDKGYHATGTVGTFGAAAAAANLMGLNAEQTAHALGLAATQTAGLKRMFGSMAKPLHAGKAAMNGVIAAQLAARGFTAGADGIEGPQGFATTMAPGFVVSPFRPDASAPFAVERTLFKYHASCYLTHSTIEIIKSLRDKHNIGIDDLEKMTVGMAPASRKVCDIPVPETGLQIKFSIRHLAALALDGANTADLGLFTDDVALDSRIGAAREKVEIEHRQLPNRSAGVVSLQTKDGRTFEGETNVGIPATDVGAQWTKLVQKARANMVPVFGEQRTTDAIEAVKAIEGIAKISQLMEKIA